MEEVGHIRPNKIMVEIDEVSNNNCMYINNNYLKSYVPLNILFLKNKFVNSSSNGSEIREERICTYNRCMAKCQILSIHCLYKKKKTKYCEHHH